MGYRVLTVPGLGEHEVQSSSRIQVAGATGPPAHGDVVDSRIKCMGGRGGLADRGSMPRQGGGALHLIDSPTKTTCLAGGGWFPKGGSEEGGVDAPCHLWALGLGALCRIRAAGPVSWRPQGRAVPVCFSRGGRRGRELISGLQAK